MRTLFWIFSCLFLAGVLLAVSLYVGAKNAAGEGTGMVLIYFLPICAVSIALGGAALAVSWQQRAALTRFERRFGWVVGSVLVLGICMVSWALAVD